MAIHCHSGFLVQLYHGTSFADPVDLEAEGADLSKALMTQLAHGSRACQLESYHWYPPRAARKHDHNHSRANQLLSSAMCAEF